MSAVRRSSRIAAKEVLKSLPTPSGRKEVQKEKQPNVKNIDLEEPMKVTVPKLVDYDSDDSQRTISDIVTPVKQVQPVKPVELVKPVEVKKEQIVKDIPMPSLEPEVKVEKETVVPEAPKPFEFAFYIIDNLSVSTSDLKGKECSICKRTKFIYTIKNYLNIIENSIGNFQISLIIEMFEFFDKNFDYMNTREFDFSKRFILVIHSKAVSLKEELDYKIKHTNPQYINDIAMFNNAKKLLERVHTKCHLYGMDKFVTDDPIYKKFLDTFIDQYLQL
jgi:hypothetical protein